MADKIEWQEDGAGPFDGAHSVQNVQGRRAHVMHMAGWRWWLDSGGDLNPHPSEAPTSPLTREEARAAAGRALVDLAALFPLGPGGQLAEQPAAAPGEAAVPPSPEGIVSEMDGGRPDPLAQAMHGSGLVPPVPAERPALMVTSWPINETPFDPTSDIRRRTLKSLEKANQYFSREVTGGVVARERSPRQTLVRRLTETAPAQVQEQLRARAEQVESFVESVHRLAEAEEVDAEMLAQLERDAASAGAALGEAAVEVRRELLKEKAIAAAVAEHHAAQLADARARLKALESRIERVEETALRVACVAAGTGATHQLKLVGATAFIKRNAGAVELEEDFDVRLLPEQFQRVDIQPDKGAIAKALKAGEVVPGCSLVVRDHVEVR